MPNHKIWVPQGMTSLRQAVMLTGSHSGDVCNSIYLGLIYAETARSDDPGIS